MTEKIQVKTEHLRTMSRSLKSVQVLLNSIDNELSQRLHSMHLEGHIRFEVDNLWSMEHRRVLAMREHASKIIALLDKTAHEFEAADGKAGGSSWVGSVDQGKSDILSTVDKAIRITSRFEGSGYVNIAGNFDGQGLSLGILQWNIGQGTLQPLLVRMNKEHGDLLKEILGKEYEGFIKVINGSKEEQLAWAKSINDNKGHVNELWKSNLTSLCETNEFQQIQTQAMNHYIEKANHICQKYNLTSEKGFALAFDISVQNGSVKRKADAIIQAAVQKANTNGSPLNENELLRVIANAVADCSKPKYHNDVLSRKMTIVDGAGTVHGTKFELERDFGLV